MIQNNSDLNFPNYAVQNMPPKNPCETCMFWGITCNQLICSIFQKYKEETKKIALSNENSPFNNLH